MRNSTMCENDITKKKRLTPLRNSNLANKPFRSPLTTVLTPRNNENLKNDRLEQSPLTPSGTPKRSISQFRNPLKKRRIEESEDSEDSYLLALKKRISDKKQELEILKTKLNYINKHKKEDLPNQIVKWRTACKEALFQFQKDLKEESSENLNMMQILAMLGIPEKIVKFTPEECGLT